MNKRLLKIGITILVVNAAAIASWGSGSDAGSLSNDVWTPGRDGNGLVNLASWNLVPENRWIEIAGTRLDGLDSAVKAAVPGWRDYGSWETLTSSWSGMAWDVRTGSERGWFTVAGGHSNSSNDGIYEFNLRQMKWRIQRLPSDVSWWPSSYIQGNSFTNFNPAVTYYTENPANAEGVYSDEFYDPSNPARSTRTPTARHTYGSTVFVPELGDSGKIVMGCRRYWEYDMAGNTWSLPKFPFGSQVGYSGEKGYTGENMQAWWNEAEGRYYVCATQNYSSSQAWSVLAGGTSWRWEGGYPVGGSNTVCTAQEKLGRTLYTLVYDDPNQLQGKPVTMIETNLDTRVQTSHAVTIGSSFSGKTFKGEWWDGQGMTFVPEMKSWYCNALTTEGMIWCSLDTASWTLDTLALPGSYPGNVNSNLETKVKYLPDLHSLVWIDYASQNIRLIKFGSGSENTICDQKRDAAQTERLWNAPEPFNPETRISYQLRAAAKVTLSILDAGGRVVTAFKSENKEAGIHSTVWVSRNATSTAAASGMYLCRLETVGKDGQKSVIVRKLILLR